MFISSSFCVYQTLERGKEKDRKGKWVERPWREIELDVIVQKQKSYIHYIPPTLLSYTKVFPMTLFTFCFNQKIA